MKNDKAKMTKTDKAPIKNRQKSQQKQTNLPTKTDKSPNDKTLKNKKARTAQYCPILALWQPPSIN